MTKLGKKLQKKANDLKKTQIEDILKKEDFRELSKKEIKEKVKEIINKVSK
jgi:hypothetical protein